MDDKSITYFVDKTFGKFVDVCDRGECPNNGVFTEGFIHDFIDIIEKGSDNFKSCLGDIGYLSLRTNIKQYCDKLKTAINDKCGLCWEVNDEIIININKSLEYIIISLS